MMLKRLSKRCFKIMKKGFESGSENSAWDKAESVLEKINSDHFQQFTPDVRYPKAVAMVLKGINGKEPTSSELRAAMRLLLPKVKILESRAKERADLSEKQFELPIEDMGSNPQRSLNDWPLNYNDDTDEVFPPGWEAVIARQDNLYPPQDD